MAYLRSQGAIAGGLSEEAAPAINAKQHLQHTLMKACDILRVRQWMSRSRVLFPILQSFYLSQAHTPITL